MQETHQQKDRTTKDEINEKTESDATSKETLRDIQDSEKDSRSTNTRDPGPSPDGLLDEGDELKDAGPM